VIAEGTIESKRIECREFFLRADPGSYDSG
jgi:hypothetical protein